MLIALVDHEATFLIVGAYALAVHGVPRSTGDIGIWGKASGVRCCMEITDGGDGRRPGARVRYQERRG
jgi:hypothetical protein